jgi:hypothetical protein
MVPCASYIVLQVILRHADVIWSSKMRNISRSSSVGRVAMVDGSLTDASVGVDSLIYLGFQLIRVENDANL